MPHRFNFAAHLPDDITEFVVLPETHDVLLTHLKTRLLASVITDVDFPVRTEAGVHEMMFSFADGSRLRVGVTDEALTLSCRLVIDGADTRDYAPSSDDTPSD